MIIWLVQYLCPHRHAVCAAPYEKTEETGADDAQRAERDLLAGMHQQGVDPWCGLCGSHDLHFEHGKLRFTDWDEAVAAMRESEVDQILTRLYFNQQRDNSN